MISRPRLTERLQASSNQKVTLISAPAGFGKTTLVGEWITEGRRPVGWVSLDEGDNDPTRFWAYFVAALQTLEVNLGKDGLAMLQSLQPAPITTILTNLINEIASFPAPFSLALDDYQAIHSLQIQEGLFFFIEHMPAQMHLVLISRTDPFLPLARLRAGNQLHEIRSADLRFTLEEAGEFLNRMMEFSLSLDDIAALERRTEGWIAGLQLAAISMKGHTDMTGFIHAFTGNHRYIVGYLVEEVFSQRPKGTLDFLLRTSILERLCAPLCDALLEKSNSQETLELLEGANLFMLPLDDQRQWFRYHQLFADVLRARLRQTQPELIPVLHRRAARWFEENELIEEAIQHALASQDFGLAASIIEKFAGPTIVSGQIRTALGWLESLPNELMLNSPNLCLIHAAGLMYSNQLDAAEARLQDGERYMNSLTGEETTYQRIIRGRLEVLRANLARIYGNLEECIAHANRSLELLPETETYWRASPLVHSASAYLLDGNVGPAREEQAAAAYLAARSSGNLFTLLRSITNLARLKIMQGCLRQAELIYRKVLEETPDGLHRLAGSASHYFGLAYYFGMGSLLFEWNDLDGSERHLHQGIDLVRGTLTADADLIILGYSCLARLRVAKGDHVGALAACDELALLAQQRKFLPRLDTCRLAENARIHLAQGDLRSAVHWAERSGMSVDDEHLPFPKQAEYLVLARVIITRGQDNPDGLPLENLLVLLDRLLHSAEAGSRMGNVIEILSLRALALNVLGVSGMAREAIFRALRLSETEGFLRVFLDMGETMHRLLLEISAGLSPAQAGAYPEATITRVLASFPWESTDHQKFSKLQAKVHSPEQAGIFTRRELEVLRLIAEGASNQDIAMRLVIAGPTVKRHISHIYDKLGVGSRTKALAQARKLGLLS